MSKNNLVKMIGYIHNTPKIKNNVVCFKLISDGEIYSCKISYQLCNGVDFFEHAQKHTKIVVDGYLKKDNKIFNPVYILCTEIGLIEYWKNYEKVA